MRHSMYFILNIEKRLSNSAMRIELIVHVLRWLAVVPNNVNVLYSIFKASVVLASFETTLCFCKPI